ncbi:murein biosynthesis integral membrane protein MurJ [Brevundimonas sp. 2R-24]|uniref:Probable lipid II flippase MurJ n=1 Tax=Peiella sedimenti TaxID=3061083 RepID=A0ABT8SMJ2_9CAUL|nr:murein biosynthesis integral membrane protein MurJ [Caulobacteraceae bacterium XZ-24]
MSLARNTLVQATLTLGSRVLGFARDLALAARFGQGPLMDVWSTALMLPNFFRRLFAEGAFAQAFVPLYAGAVEAEGEEAAARMASEALAFILTAVAAVTILLQLLMPWLMPWLLSAWAQNDQVMSLGVLAAQLAMPYLACMTIAALLSGVLNTSGRFALSAGVPILLNLCTLAALLAPLFLPGIGAESVLLWTTLAVTVSGILQAGLLWWGVRRVGVRLRLRLPRLTPAVKRTLSLAVPGAAAGGAMQINTLVSQLLTGSDPGARSVLYNADRLYQLPLGLVGVAIGLALVPRLSRAFVAGDEALGQRTLNDGLVLALALTLPAAAALLTIPFFLIDATMTRGAFTSEDAARTAAVLRHFAWGVPAFVLAKVLTPPFFARQDTRRPMRYAVTSVGVNVVIGAGLFFWLSANGGDGVLGLAIGTSTAAWVNVGLLAWTLVREGAWRPDAALAGRLARLSAAVMAMAGLLLVAAWNYRLLSDLLWRKEIAVVAVAGAGAAFYGVMVLALRAASLSELKAALRREPGAGRETGPGGPSPD